LNSGPWPVRWSGAADRVPPNASGKR
jgi:hypothetical protein